MTAAAGLVAAARHGRRKGKESGEHDPPPAVRCSFKAVPSRAARRGGAAGPGRQVASNPGPCLVVRVAYFMSFQVILVIT